MFSTYQTVILFALRNAIKFYLRKGRWSKSTISLSALRSTRFWTLRQPCSSKFLNLSPIKMLRLLHFLVLFAVYSAFTTLEKTSVSWLYSKLQMFHTIVCKFRVHQKAFLWDCTILDDENSVLNVVIEKRWKKSKSLIMCPSANSIRSTIQEILRRKLTNLKMDENKSLR